MNTIEEKRTEYVGMYLTPTMAKQLKDAGDNEVLKDKILKQFVTNETEWLKEEVQNMDEITAIYRAKLLTIRDNFSKAQDIYVEEIEALINNTSSAIYPLTAKFDNLKKNIEEIKNQTASVSNSIASISKNIDSIEYWKLEKLIDIVEKYNNMSETEKELIKLLIERQ